MPVVENTSVGCSVDPDLRFTDGIDKTDQDMNNGYMHVSMKEQEERVKGLHLS